MVALVVLMVVIFATAAYAQTFYGGSGTDEFFDTPGNDQMYGYGGNDHLLADEFAGDRDKLYGGRGKDDLDVADGDPDDVADGGRGEESTCYADVGDEVHRCDGNVTWFK